MVHEKHVGIRTIFQCVTYYNVLDRFNMIVFSGNVNTIV